MCPRSLERSDKQLQDWLAKDPSNNISTTPGDNNMKSKGLDGEESPDKSGDGNLTPTRSKKRILLSQSMNGNPLFNLESGQVLETTFEEDILSTGLGDESLIISPVVVGNTSTNRVDRERGSKELDQTLLGDLKEDSHENQDRTEVSANVPKEENIAKGDSHTLGGLQSFLTEEYVEAHFSASSQSVMYYQALFLTGQFEAAVDFLFRSRDNLTCHATHLALAMFELELLSIHSNIQAPLLSRDTTDRDCARRLNLARLVMLYVKHFESTDPKEALQYFYFLKGGRSKNLFMSSEGDLVLQNMEFDLFLGQLMLEGTRALGLVDTGTIIELVARYSEVRELLEDSVRLYDLASIMMVNMSELVQGFKVTVALFGTILAISEREGLPPSSKMKDLGEEHKSYRKSGWCTGFGLKGGSPPTPTETFAPSGSSSEDGEETFAPSGSSSEESEEIDGLDKSSSPPVTIVTNFDRTPALIISSCSTVLPTLLVRKNIQESAVRQRVKCECEQNCENAVDLLKDTEDLEAWKSKFIGPNLTETKNRILIYLRAQSDVINCYCPGIMYKGHTFCNRAFSSLTGISSYILGKVIEANARGVEKFHHGNSDTPKNSPNKTNAISWFKTFCDLYCQSSPDNVMLVCPSFLTVTTLYQMYQQETPIKSAQIAYSTFCDMIKKDFGPRRRSNSLPWVRFSKHSSHSRCDICSDLDKYQRTCRSQRDIDLCRALKYKHKERLGNQRRCISNLRHLSQTLPDQFLSIFIDGMDNMKVFKNSLCSFICKYPWLAFAYK